MFDSRETRFQLKTFQYYTSIYISFTFIRYLNNKLFSGINETITFDTDVLYYDRLVIEKVNKISNYNLSQTPRNEA